MKSCKINFNVFHVYILVVLPPCVPALGAAEEPDFAFVSSPQLAQPPDCEVIVAFRAPNLDGGHGFYFFLLIVDNGDLVLGAFLFFLHLVSPGDLPDIPAFPALELTPRRDQHCLTFRAEHCYNHAQAEQIKLWMIPRREEQRCWYMVNENAG
jgi:hypothetical protein